MKPSRKIDGIYRGICEDAHGTDNNDSYGYWPSGEPKRSSFYLMAVVKYLDEQAEAQIGKEEK